MDHAQQVTIGACSLYGSERQDLREGSRRSERARRDVSFIDFRGVSRGRCLTFTLCFARSMREGGLEVVFLTALKINK